MGDVFGGVNLISFFISAIKIIFLLGFLILIHEGGHFLVAKLCKVKVNEFAIGFGPTIWRANKGETKYALRLIPLGGFVSMEGEEERSEAKGSFSQASIPKRIAIVLAGGMVNIIFGLLVFLVLTACMGNFGTTIVKDTIQGYSAEESGILPGDQITKINDKKVRNQTDLNEAVQETNGEKVKVTLVRNKEKQEIEITPTKVENKNIGIYFDATETEPIIISIYPGSVADREGLEVKDKITKVDGIDVSQDVYQAIDKINHASTDTIQLTIQRNDATLEIELKPDIVYTYYLGVNLEKAENNIINNMYYAFWDTTDFAFSIVDNLKMLFTGKVSANQLTGPVGISEMVADTKGIYEYIYMLALISLSLGVTNLLPFPPLDGGKVVILLIEAIRRKPLKENVEIAIQSAGFFLLITLSIYVAYNDVLRIF